MKMYQDIRKTIQDIPGLGGGGIRGGSGGGEGIGVGVPASNY